MLSNPCVRNVYFNSADNFNYVFQQKDHVGNIRSSYTWNAATSSLAVLEENHYYPFGLKHNNYSTDQNDYRVRDEAVVLEAREALAAEAQASLFMDNNYRFNGQEWQDEFRLNMTAMDFRLYDNALARFNAIDAMAEVDPSASPYQFGNNNPVYWSDPSGLLSKKFLTNIWENSGDDSFWTNDGAGNFEEFEGSGFIDTQGDYYELLPEVVIKLPKYHGRSASFIGQLQSHVYWNSKSYSGFRSGQRSKQMDSFQSGLDYLGTVPVIGEPIDLLNAGISSLRGDYTSAALSVAAMVPVVGVAATGVKKMHKHHIIPKAVYRDAGEAIQSAMRLDGGNNLKKLPAGFHGNHPQYSVYVRNQLNTLKQAGATPGSIQTLQKNLNGMINTAYDNYKTTGQNLNDYFRQFNTN